MRLLSWNVEHFKNGTKIKPVADLIKKANPDIFALYEAENLDVLSLMRDHFSTYSFHITDSPEVQEVLVGYRTNSTYQATFTQKREFNAYNPSLKSGALLTLRKQQQYLNLLFLHTDSGTDAPAFGNRAEMFDKVWKLKEAIDRLAGSGGHLIATGDFNTMGLYFPTKSKRNEAVLADWKIALLGDAAKKAKLSLITKEFDPTFNNGSLESNLDHVLAREELTLKSLGKRADDTPFHVAV